MWTERTTPRSTPMIETILALILALTGIARGVDPGLTEIAEQRAQETATDATFNHDSMRPGTWEVLAWNLNYPGDPARRAVEQWQGSAGHWEILTNASLTRIGCGHAVGPDGRHNFACVLAQGATIPEPGGAAEPVVVARTPNPMPVGSTPTSGATPAPATPLPMLPDTAMPVLP